MRIHRSLRVAAVAAALALTATACGGSDEPADVADESTDEMADDEMADDEMADDEMADDEMADDEMAADLSLVSDGQLTVCSEVPYEPFEFEDPDAPSGYSGFDIDLVQAIADDLGLELTVINAGFDALTSGAAFAAGTCDMAASAMTITEERDESIDFSDGYYNAAQSLAVPTGSDLTTLADVEGRLGVQSGTTGAAYAEENAPDTAEVVSFDAGADLFLALTSGDIVAILQDLPVNVEREKANGDITVVETYETDENYGLAFPEDGAEDLIEAVNASLAELRDSGEYDEIFESYFS